MTVVRAIFVTDALLPGKFLSYGQDTLPYNFSLKHVELCFGCSFKQKKVVHF